jgi:hypothetical protein
MGAPTRRAVVTGSTAFASLAAVHASGLASPAEAASTHTGRGHRKGNVLLVHGAWVDGSSWSQVIPILKRHGHTVVAVQLPPTSLPDDVACLVFASAFARDQGETLGGLGVVFPPPPGLAHTQPDSLGFLWFDPAAIPTNFAPRHPPGAGASARRGTEADRRPRLHRPPGATSLHDAAVVVPGLHAGPDDQPRPGAIHGQAHRRHHRRGPLQPRTAGLPPARGRQADPGGGPGGGAGLHRRHLRTTPAQERLERR